MAEDRPYRIAIKYSKPLPVRPCDRQGTIYFVDGKMVQSVWKRRSRNRYYETKVGAERGVLKALGEDNVSCITVGDRSEGLRDKWSGRLYYRIVGWLQLRWMSKPQDREYAFRDLKKFTEFFGGTRIERRIRERYGSEDQDG